MKAYDFLFGNDQASLLTHPDRPESELLSPQAQRAGWIGGPSAGIAPETWPRSESTGESMVHILTLRLPEEYQTRGPEFPGISFYAGEGQFAEPSEPDPDSDDPFEVQRATARPHPEFRPLWDIIDGGWGLLWLTEAELAGRTDPPVDVRREGEHLSSEHEGVNAWDDGFDELGLLLTGRDDPNAGVTPADHGEDTDYQQPLDGSHWQPWAEPLYGRSHLGGTTFFVQALPEDLTPFYLELEEFGPLNFGGGGNAQIDLESGAFDWAC